MIQPTKKWAETTEEIDVSKQMGRLFSSNIQNIRKEKSTF